MTSQTDSTHHISLADEIESARRIVIKIGSALLFDGKSGEARQHWLDRLGDDIAALSRQGKEVIIVSSFSYKHSRVQIRPSNVHSLTCLLSITQVLALREAIEERDLVIEQMTSRVSEAERTLDECKSSWSSRVEERERWKTRDGTRPNEKERGKAL